MRSLGPPDFISLWERGEGLHALDRGLLVLGAALPEISREEAADWPLGRRNRMLSAVRCESFGPQLRGWAECTECGEKLEFEVDGRMLADGAEGSGLVTVGAGSFRLPTTRDLARIVREADGERAGARLAEMCRVGPGEALTGEEMEALGRRLAEADPMAEILLEMLCPVCGFEGRATLDLVSFLWEELEVFAKRLLLEVHCLASAYGWSEEQILALSEARRSLYLDWVQA